MKVVLAAKNVVKLAEQAMIQPGPAEVVIKSERSVKRASALWCTSRY